MIDKIFIQEGEIHRTEKTFDNDVEYIRKNAIIEWIKSQRWSVRGVTWETLINMLNSL